MTKITFSYQAWKEYCFWQTQDKKTLRKINELLKDISRNKLDGIGKVEILKHNLNGFYSRRIDNVNRLVYRVTNKQIEIIQCRGHY